MELVLLSLAALAALVTLLWPARRLWGLVLLLFLVGAAGAFARPGPPRAGTERDPETALRPIAVREKGYVSSDTCRACHPGEYASWHRTFHRTMTQVVTPETVISNWHGTELTLRGKTLFLERVDDEFWVDMVDPEYTEDRAVNTRPVASSNRTRRVRKRGVDSGIHLVHRARVVADGDVNLLTTSTARAVAYSALTTIASFGSLGLATHLGLQTLGRLLTIGVGFTLVCNLIVLPALIRLRPDRSKLAGTNRAA